MLLKWDISFSLVAIVCAEHVSCHITCRSINCPVLAVWGGFSNSAAYSAGAQPHSMVWNGNFPNLVWNWNFENFGLKFGLKLKWFEIEISQWFEIEISQWFEIEISQWFEIEISQTISQTISAGAHWPPLRRSLYLAFHLSISPLPFHCEGLRAHTTEFNSHPKMLFCSKIEKRNMILVVHFNKWGAAKDYFITGRANTIFCAVGLR